MAVIHKTNELYHYGIKGQKWGVRRYQNADGSLTTAGKRRVQDSGELLRPAFQNSTKKASRNSKRGKARWDVVDEFEKEEAKILDEKKQQTIRSGYPEHRARELASFQPDTMRAVGQKVHEIIDKYADATISDLGLSNTKAARQFVKKHLNDSMPGYYKQRLEKYESFEKAKKAYQSDTRTMEQKRKDINTEYKSKIAELDRRGESTKADLVFDEWMSALDGLEYDRKLYGD